MADHAREFGIVVVVWGVIGLLMAVADHLAGDLASDTPSLLRIVVAMMLFMVVGAGLNPIAYAVAKRSPFLRQLSAATIGTLVVVGFILASLLAAALTLIQSGFLWITPLEESREGWMHMFASNFPRGLMAFLVNVLIAYAFLYEKRSREQLLKASKLESDLAQAQLRALKSKLQPHFLFNILHTIVALVRRGDRDGAISALTQLSHLLRATLSSVEIQEVHLTDELHLAKLYLKLHQILLKDQLTVVMDVEAEALEAMVPSFILQPLVENAIYHGVKGRLDTATIEVRVGVTNDLLRLIVRDDGPGVRGSLSELEKNGIGLAATHKRLQTMYGDNFEFSLTSQPPGGAVAVVVVPFRTAPHETATLGTKDQDLISHEHEMA